MCLLLVCDKYLCVVSFTSLRWVNDSDLACYDVSFTCQRRFFNVFHLFIYVVSFSLRLVYDVELACLRRVKDVFRLFCDICIYLVPFTSLRRVYDVDLACLRRVLDFFHFVTPSIRRWPDLFPRRVFHLLMTRLSFIGYKMWTTKTPHEFLWGHQVACRLQPLISRIHHKNFKNYQCLNDRYIFFINIF